MSEKEEQPMTADVQSAQDAQDQGQDQQDQDQEFIGAGIVDEARIKPYDAVEAGLAALSERASVHYDLTTKEGLREAKTFARDLSKLRSRLEASRKGAKAFFMSYVTRVNERAEEIRTRILAIEDPLKKRIADYEAEQERIRIEQETLRRNREEAIRKLMEPLQRAVIEMAGKGPEAIRDRIQAIQAMKAAEIDDQNVTQAWLAARNEALRNLALQLSAAEASEKLRIEAERREERLQRLQSVMQALSAPVVLASQRSSIEAMTAQIDALDAILGAVQGEDPSFMAQVQEAHRNSRRQVESMIAALKTKLEQEAKLKAEREQFEKEQAAFRAAQAEHARQQAEAKAKADAEAAQARAAAEAEAARIRAETEAAAAAQAQAQAQARAEADRLQAELDAVAAKVRADAEAEEARARALSRAAAEAAMKAAEQGRTPAFVLDRLAFVLEHRHESEEVRVLLETMAASIIRGDDTEAGRILRIVIELDAQYREQQGDPS